MSDDTKPLQDTRRLQIGELPMLRSDVDSGRYDIVVGSTVVRTHLELKPGSHRLAVFSNGALNLSEVEDPGAIFQRRSWAEEIDSHCLFLSDPTVSHETGINIGWGQGTKRDFFLSAAASAVQTFADVFGVGDPSNRLYFGSSGGGFQSLVLAGFDPGSSALVNNPQTVWTNYVSRHAVSRVLKHVYAGMTKEDVLALYPDRVSAVKLYDLLGRVPRITYLVNAASHSDLKRDLPELITDMDRIGRVLSDTVTIRYYWDESAGHNPIGKTATIREINAELVRLPGRNGELSPCH